MNADVARLVERLDGWADDLSCGEAGHGADQDVREAASTIRALVEEIKRLREDFRDCYADLGSTMTKLCEAVEVMRQISMACDIYGEDLSFGDMETVHRIQGAARAFLKGMEGGK